MSPSGRVRRIVVVDQDDRGVLLEDGFSPDVRTDPARPGFASTRIWVNDATPKVLAGPARDARCAAHDITTTWGVSPPRVHVPSRKHLHP